MFPSSPCRNHHHPPSITRVGQGWLVRSSGSVNAFRIVFEKSALFCNCSSSDFCYWTGKNGISRVSSYCKLVSRWIILPLGKMVKSVEQLHWVKMNFLLINHRNLSEWWQGFYLGFDIHARCHWLSIQLDLHFHPHFSCSLSIDWVTSCAWESCWERHEQLLVSIVVKWHVLLKPL